MAYLIRKAHERGHADHGWLKTFHTFSFADYYDEAWMHFKALRVMNEDFIAPGKGFDPHPHRDMEILTYVLKGALRHVDTMGNNEVIRAGEFQRMSAGTGVRHMELSATQDEETHLYQIWILPKEQGLAPSYEQKPFYGRLEQERRVLIASRDGRDESLKIHQDVDVWLRRLLVGESTTLTLPDGKEAWVQVISGEAQLSSGERVTAGDGIATTEALSFKPLVDFETLEFVF